jgi:hypothetical protein
MYQPRAPWEWATEEKQETWNPIKAAKPTMAGLCCFWIQPFFQKKAAGTTKAIPTILPRILGF